ncbi:unnamed protein product, partial [Ectocarpus sp. 8 AP-2014]
VRAVREPSPCRPEGRLLSLRRRSRTGRSCLRLLERGSPDRRGRRGLPQTRACVRHKTGGGGGGGGGIGTPRWRSARWRRERLGRIEDGGGVCWWR